MPWMPAAVFLVAAVFAIAAEGQQPSLPQPVVTATAASAAPLPAVVPSGRPSIGLALEGGGALGFAHIGILQWLEEHRIPVDRLAGTSMGSLVGALYAIGDSPAELRKLALSDTLISVFTLQSAYSDVSFRRRQDRSEVPQAITVGLRHGLNVRNALLSDRGVNTFLVSNMSAYNRQELDYNRMPIPFRCVATDLTSLQSVTFASGPLPQAVRASISIPGVFPPVQDSKGHFLVDGGILDNLPTDVLKHDLHADVIIAIRLQDSPLTKADTSSAVGVLSRAFSAGIVRNVDQAERLADVVVMVPVGKFSGMDYGKAAPLIDAGYKAAEQNRAVLLSYALDEAGWNAYLAERKSRRHAQPALLRLVRVDGGDPAAVQAVMSDMKPLEGQPITPATTYHALKNIQANGMYAADFETFGPAPASAVSTPDTGILVHLGKDPTGPPYLVFGPDVAASTSNVTRSGMSFRLLDQNWGGFGSEFRARAHIGSWTEVSAEYYRLLTPSGYFVQPSAGIIREPIYIWANQKRVAERFRQNLSTGIRVGRTFNNQLQVSTEWRVEDTHWSLQTGTGGGPYLSGIAQTGLLHIDLDKAGDDVVSPNGFRLSASAGALYLAAGSDNAPIATFSFSHTHSWKNNRILAFSGEADSYFRARVAQPYRFTLGGPLRLSASSFGEYRGTDLYLARAGYMHRIAALPTGLGHGLYAFLSYEGGQVWSPDERSFLRQDGTTGLIANTPIGVLTLGAAVGDAGHRKVFVTLGRWF